jgi:hypothetical protein
MSDEGTGLSLDQNFDLVISSVGDLEKEDGLDELEKDLAMQVAYTLRNAIGQPDSTELSSQIKSLSRRAVEADVRIDEVLRNSIRIRKIERGTEITYQVSMRAIVSGEQEELVFEIEQ